MFGSRAKEFFNYLIMQYEARLLYLVGASGSGKDSILKAFKQKAIAQNKPVIIAHRYITRTNTGVNQELENFISLTLEEFELRKHHDLFAMHWQANDCHYGIGVEVHQWLSQGLTVIVNGSRGYLENAQKIFNSQIQSININVSDDMLKERLLLRGRESTEEIEKRLQRHQKLNINIGADKTIDNNGSLDHSVNQLMELVFPH
jgi:ribose 1,5-bisphosphokinase